MAYSNAIFYIDLVSGSDATRSTLASCTASNPSGSVTRINKTAHGLVTGAVVTLSNFTAWLNGAWKITVVDANNFDLDSAVWQTTADASGNCVPFGGSSWTDAWATINSGATAARIAPGDVIRIAKTPDRISMSQNATFTNASTTVTLTTAVTKKIEDAISGWTAATNITTGTNGSRKIGATSVTITPAAAFTTGKVAYKAIAGGGTQDFSAYSKICLWIRPTSASAIAANTYKICLCSDATGDTIVNEINIPGILASSAWMTLVLDYGAALSSSVQSVAIYANSDPGTTVIAINNIFAANDLTLKSVIGKNSETMFAIQSIDGTTIKIDANNTSVGGRGYSGTTETVTIYRQEPFYIPNNISTYISIPDSGSIAANYIEFTGGWNTSSNLQDGYTCIAAPIVNATVGISLQNYIKMNNFKLFKFSIAISGTYITNIHIKNFYITGCYSMAAQQQNAALYENLYFYNNSSSASASISPAEFLNCEFRSLDNSPAVVSNNSKFYGCTFANNNSYSIGCTSNGSSPFGTGSTQLKNCTLSDTNEVQFTSYQYCWSFDHDNTPGNHWGFTYGGTINWQTTTKQGSDPGSWKFILTSTTLSSTYVPIRMKVCDIACQASTLVTCKVWIKKDHATSIGARLVIQDGAYSVDGVTAATVTKADDTNWEEVTITFTPSQAGVVPVFVEVYYISGSTSNAYVGSITVTQA